MDSLKFIFSVLELTIHQESGLKVLRNNDLFARVYVYEHCSNCASNPNPKTIIHEEYKYFPFLQQAKFLLAEKYTPYLSHMPCNTADLNQVLQDLPALQNPSVSPRKRKRSRETEPPQKRRQVAFTDSSTKDINEQPVLPTIGEDNVDPIVHWIQKGHWSKDYFVPDSQDRESLNKYLCLQNYLDKQEEIKMAYLLARAKSTDSLRRKQSESSNATPSDPTPSDQQPRETKSSVYMTAAYETILATKGSYMARTPLKITEISKTLCQSLLNTEQTVPQDTLFRDDLFDETCNSVEGRNEAMVVRYISPLICLSPLVLRIYGAKNLDCLTESVNKGWNSAIPVVYSRPQPDYSVGFGRFVFTDEQLEKLKPFIGEIASLYTSYFMGTWRMYFPFLTCEVKCGAAALDVADR